ncbi:MAG TPA: DUF262 domain-containing HNH endonuclease family protein [Oculatellaceae cyanobacterium]
MSTSQATGKFVTGAPILIEPRYLNLIDLLSKRLFRIPQYQRAYSWGKKERADMFEDIRALKSAPETTFHFMATIVGLRRDTTTIVTDKFNVIEVVDGQQRLTTLVVLLKAIQKKLDRSLTTNMKLVTELGELLVKQDDVSLILLQTNHDNNRYFIEYVRNGTVPDLTIATTLADRETIQSFIDCERFVDTWTDKVELLRIIKNQLTFIFHELSEESTVYTVFEVLNNRGLNVSWLDRLKSMLMSIAFEEHGGNFEEHLTELHEVWTKIYQAIGLRQGLSTESMRFAATLRSKDAASKPFGEEKAVDLLRNCKTAAAAIEVSSWLLKVTIAVNKFLEDTKGTREAVTTIAQARLLAIAILLRDFPQSEQTQLLDAWEKTTFRIFGLCRKDARTAVGDYVRLARDLFNTKLSATVAVKQIRELSANKEHSIDWAEAQIRNENCYEGWEDELRYLMFRYEEHLSKQAGQKFSNEQWSRIWQASSVQSIEHIWPASKGSQKPVDDKSDQIFVHRLGNLVLLPPGLNKSLQDREPKEKAEAYIKTGLNIAAEVGEIIQTSGWGPAQVKEREERIVQWIKETWV